MASKPAMSNVQNELLDAYEQASALGLLASSRKSTCGRSLAAKLATTHSVPEAMTHTSNASRIGCKWRPRMGGDCTKTVKR